MPLSKECWSELNAIVERYQGDPADAVVVWCKDRIVEICIRHSQAYKQVFHCKSVGIHPKNRNTECFILRRATTRGVQIVNLGWSDTTIQADALAMEDHPIHKHIAHNTVKCTVNCRGAAQYKLEEVKIGPLGATHCNHFLAMVHDEVPCNETGISEDGKVSKKLCHKDSGILRASTVGVEWLVFRHAIEEAFDVIPTIIQSALNAVSQMAEGESWIQNLLKTVDTYSKLYGSADDRAPATKAEENKVAKVILQSEPPRRDDVSDIVAFCFKWGGLPTGSFVRQLTDEFTACVPSERIVSGSVFRKLASLKYPPNQLPAHFINAALLTHAEASEQVQDGYARFIGLGEFESMASPKNLARVMEYDGHVKRAMKLVASADTRKPSERIESIVAFKSRLVRLFLKRKDTIDKYPTVQDIVKALTDEIAGTTTEAVVEEPKDKESAHNVVHYTDDGDTVNIGELTLENLGFSVGTRVYNVKESVMDQFEVREVTNLQVKLATVDVTGQIDAKAKNVVMTYDTFRDGYKKCDKLELLSKYPSELITPAHKDLNVMYYRSFVVQAIVALSLKHPVVPGEFRVTSKPSLRVYATRAFKPNELILVPTTTAIACRDSKYTYNPRLAEVTFDDGAAPSFLLSVPHQGVSIFFMASIKYETDKTNLVFKDMNVTTKLPSIGDAQNRNEKVTMTVNCMTNDKPIEKDEEMVIYRQQPQKKNDTKRVMSTVECSGTSSKKPKLP